eukprot:2913895-Pleurochrysis_carterae.AAC.1
MPPARQQPRRTADQMLAHLATELEHRAPSVGAAEQVLRAHARVLARHVAPAQSRAEFVGQNGAPAVEACKLRRVGLEHAERKRALPNAESARKVLALKRGRCLWQRVAARRQLPQRLELRLVAAEEDDHGARARLRAEHGLDALEQRRRLGIRVCAHKGEQQEPGGRGVARLTNVKEVVGADESRRVRRLGWREKRRAEQRAQRRRAV